MRAWFRKLGRALVGALRASLVNEAPRVAAGLAYYMSFSIAPILLITILLAGAFYALAEPDLTAEISRLIPGGGGDAVRILLEGLRQSRGTGMAASIGIAALVFGATGVFNALQAALDDIWGVQPPAEYGWVRLITRRLYSLAMVLAVAVLLLVSLLINTLMALLVERFGGLLPGGAGPWSAINVALALATGTGIFTLVFKFVPDAPVRWVSALVGGLVTAALFWLGETVLAWYFGDAARLSIYGIFGSLIVLLLWVYYSAQILLFGAEVAKSYGSIEEFQ